MATPPPKRKKLPRFKSDEAFAKFWETHSLTDYLDQLEEVKPFVLSPALKRRIRRRRSVQRLLEKLLNEWKSLQSYWQHNDSLLCFPKGQNWFFKQVPKRYWKKYFASHFVVGLEHGEGDSVKKLKALWKGKSARTIHREILFAKAQGKI